MADAARAAVQVFRTEHAQVFGGLWRRLGEFDLVDAAMADAYLAAQAAWPATGVPQNPVSWMATVAMSATTSVLAKRGADLGDPASPADDVRALLFGVCHPNLAPEERVVCLARAAVGLVPHEIAALLGLPESTVNARLTSAKKTMRQPGNGLGPVADADRAARETLVHTTIAELKRAAKGDDAQNVSAVLAARVNQAFATT
jgi:predicted RNA polymerase sigma factor